VHGPADAQDRPRVVRLRNDDRRPPWRDLYIMTFINMAIDAHRAAICWIGKRPAPFPYSAMRLV